MFGVSSPCIWRRKVSGSGMPGVDVTPGLAILFALAGFGMPGVGVVPFGSGDIALIGEIPGVALAIGELTAPEFTFAFIGLSTTGGTLELLSTLTELELV